ncbi:50S ribosomal protein L16 [Candidatus Woesearchaeota archaeon]|nr:50S ribosomal protein L16 [Candidatus Woesearchaeota archaeon]
MARLRKAVAYRRLERPYTRVSKFKKKSFIKTTYNTRITKFVMGNMNQSKFDSTVRLKSLANLQIRDNSLESARLCSNRLLEKTIGPTNYFLRINKYPFHILRNNPLASGAGADRFSTGMAHPFGKPIGQAAQFRKGDTVIEIKVDLKNINLAKRALKSAATKLPCGGSIEIERNHLKPLQ